MFKTEKCLVFGAGGHARVLIDTLLTEKKVDPVIIFEKNSSLWGKELYGIPILSDTTPYLEILKKGITRFVVGIGGDPMIRQQLYEGAISAGLKPHTTIHPSASVSLKASLGQGVQILPISIVNAGATIGNNVIINSGAIVEHDCIIGDHVHIASGSTLASTVKVGTSTHIGAGASIKQCLLIGDHVIIGAGAVVIKDIPSGVTAFGVPAVVQEKNL